MMLRVAKWGLVTIAAGAALFLIVAIVSPAQCTRAIQQRAKRIGRDSDSGRGRGRGKNGTREDDSDANDAELTRLVAGYGSSQDTRPQLVFSGRGDVSHVTGDGSESEGDGDGELLPSI